MSNKQRNYKPNNQINTKDEEILFRNNFVRTNVSTTSQLSTTSEDFKRYYLKKKGITDYTNYNSIAEFSSDKNNKDIDTTHINSTTNSYEKKTTLMIDSSQRDKVLYPNINSFKATFSKTFKNVKEISLVSSAFPNTDQVIKNTPEQIQNNIITWENYEDIDLGVFTDVQLLNSVQHHIDIVIPNHGLSNYKYNGNLKVRIFNSTSLPNVDGTWYVSIPDTDTLRFKYYNGIFSSATCDVDIGIPNYTVSLEPGNYSIKTIADQMKTQMNLIKRRNGNGIYHYFDVSANIDTDVLTFHNTIVSQLSIDCISTSAGSSIVSVTFPNHGLKNGDTIIIVGAKSVGGLNSSILNGNFLAIVSDSSNTFSYEVSDRAVTSTTGGGSTVKVGKKSPFRFLFNTAKSLIVDNVGFANEDSSVLYENITFSTKVYYAEDIEIINSQTGIRITTTENHDLVENTVIDITSISNTFPAVITTSGPHNLNDTTSVFITNTNTEPVLNGFFNVVSYGINKLILSQVYIEQPGTTGKLKFGGDRVIIRNLKSSPLIEDDIPRIVENVTGNTFEIQAACNYISQEEIHNVSIGTDHLYVNHPSHTFNEIISILPGSYPGSILITTLLEHKLTGKTHQNILCETIVNNSVDLYINNHSLSVSDLIVVKNSTTVPSIDGSYFIQVVDQNTIRINVIGGVDPSGTATVYTGNTITLSSTNSVPCIDVDINGRSLYNINYISPNSFEVFTGVTLTQNGTSGIIGRNNNVVFYRVQADDADGNIGGINIGSINSNYFPISKIIDSNNYLIKIHNQFSTKNVVGKGGPNTSISHVNYGQREFQLNTKDYSTNTTLYKSVRLSGEDFVFLSIQNLDTFIYTSPNNLGDIFGVVLLNQPPGYTIYNSFISSPKVFARPLASLSSITIDVIRKDGIPFNFNNIDYILVFEITELVTGIKFEDDALVSGKFDNDGDNTAKQQLGKSGERSAIFTQKYGYAYAT